MKTPSTRGQFITQLVTTATPNALGRLMIQRWLDKHHDGSKSDRFSTYLGELITNDWLDRFRERTHDGIRKIIDRIRDRENGDTEASGAVLRDMNAFMHHFDTITSAFRVEPPPPPVEKKEEPKGQEVPTAVLLPKLVRIIQTEAVSVLVHSRGNTAQVVTSLKEAGHTVSLLIQLLDVYTNLNKLLGLMREYDTATLVVQPGSPWYEYRILAKHLCDRPTIIVAGSIHTKETRFSCWRLK